MRPHRLIKTAPKPAWGGNVSGKNRRMNGLKRAVASMVARHRQVVRSAFIL